MAGQTTYESFPNRTLPNRNIYVLTFDAGYEVSDPEHHFVVTNVNDFKDFDGDLYISGGASVYNGQRKADAGHRRRLHVQGRG